MNGTYLGARIAKTKELIEAYEDATLALAGGAQSYTFDTGQTRHTVTKFDLEKLNAMIDTLYNRLAMLEARLTGSGVVNVRPGW